MGENIFRQSVLILLILAFFGISGVSAATVNYYTLNEPVTTTQGLSLESFKVSGENQDIHVGDTINLMQMMSYNPESYNQLVIDQPGGISFEVTNPEGRAYRLNTNYVGKAISPGDYVSIKDSFIPDIEGVWKIKPSYTVTAGAAKGKIFPPDYWPIAEITVAKVEDPKPDLVIEGVSADFDYTNGLITKITYVVKNVGDVDAEASVTKIKIDGTDIGSDSAVGYLPAGKSLTVFVPVNVKYNGFSSLIEVTPNAEKAFDEADYENNYFDTIIDNPVDNAATTIESKPASDDLKSQSVSSGGIKSTDIVSADTCLAYNQNCNTIFTCSIIGLLSILLSAVTFALGYYYGVSKNCRKEMAWMRSKIAYLRSTDPNAAEGGENVDGANNAAEKFIEKYYGESISDADKDSSEDKKEKEAADKKSEAKDAKDKDNEKDNDNEKDKSDELTFEFAEGEDISEDKDDEKSSDGDSKSKKSKDSKDAKK